MATNRLWIAGTAIVVIAAVALGWVLGISPKLAEAAAADATRASVEAANTIRLQELAALKAQFEGIEDIRDQLDALQQEIPVDADLPDFIRQLNTMAAKVGVTIDSISPGEPTQWTRPSTPLTDENGNPLDMTGVPDTFVMIPIIIKVTGTYGQILAFNQALQTGERLFLVGTLVAVSTGDSEADQLKSAGEVDGLIFVLPGTRARPEDEEPTPEPTPTETSTPTPTATATPAP